MDCQAGVIFYLSRTNCIESNNENIRLVEIGNTGMSDDLIHDNVVVNRLNTDGCNAHYKGL